jgi:hypothetical protein
MQLNFGGWADGENGSKDMEFPAAKTPSEIPGNYLVQHHKYVGYTVLQYYKHYFRSIVAYL